MKTRFAAAITDQGRFANTCIGEFTFTPEAKAHIWKGKIATTMAELAEHINSALKSLEDYHDPLVKVRVVEVQGDEATAPETDEDAPTRETVNAALIDANSELQGVVQKISQRGPTLRVLDLV